MRVGGRVPAEQQERVRRRDLRERRHHDDVGEEDRPAVDPAEVRAQRRRHPRERRARSRVGLVQVAVGRARPTGSGRTRRAARPARACRCRRPRR